MNELEKLKMENLELRNQVLEMKLEKLIHRVFKIDERIKAKGDGSTQAVKMPRIERKNARCYHYPLHPPLQLNYSETAKKKYQIKNCTDGRFKTNKNRVVSLPLADVRYLKEHLHEYQNFTTKQFHRLARDLFTTHNTLQRTLYNIEIGTFDKFLEVSNDG